MASGRRSKKAASSTTPPARAAREWVRPGQRRAALPPARVERKATAANPRDGNAFIPVLPTVGTPAGEDQLVARDREARAGRHLRLQSLQGTAWQRGESAAALAADV